MDFKIGVVGYGVVGGATGDYFEQRGYEVVKEDPKFGETKWHDILTTDICFVCVPTPTVNDKQDLSIVETVLARLGQDRFSGIVIIKSTVLPGTCQRLKDQHKVRLVHNPEFLTEKNALNDFINQKAILLSGYIDDVALAAELYQATFPRTKIISNTDFKYTETAKYAHNCFLATKVIWFNQMYFACQKMGIDYNQMMNMALALDKIGLPFTTVPGPSNGPTPGKFGVNGMCFPKDTQALSDWADENGLGEEFPVLKAAIEYNKKLLQR